MTASISIVDKWISVVGAFVMPATPADGVEALMRIKIGLLDFPPHAFTRASAIAVATAKRYGPVPDLAVITETLNAYVRDNPQPVALVADPLLAALKPEDRAWLRFWHTKMEKLATKQSQAEYVNGIRHAASLVRQQSPDAYLVICRDMGWANPDREIVVSETDRGEIQRLMIAFANRHLDA